MPSFGSCPACGCRVEFYRTVKAAQKAYGKNVELCDEAEDGVHRK